MTTIKLFDLLRTVARDSEIAVVAGGKTYTITDIVICSQEHGVIFKCEPVPPPPQAGPVRLVENR